MTEPSTAGLFSRLHWGRAELLLHTEISRSPESTVTTLLMADGVVLSRAEGPWPPGGGGQGQEQRRLKGYHERLMKAMRRLRDEKSASLEDLSGLFKRIAAVALKLGASPASEALWSLSEGRWVVLLNEDGKAKDSAPRENSGSDWHASSMRILELARDLSKAFGSGAVANISMRTTSGRVVLVPGEEGTALAEIETDKTEEARSALTRLASEVGW